MMTRANRGSPLFIRSRAGKSRVRELQEKGIIDPQGRRIRKELPPDMQEVADCDFRG